MWHFFGFWFSYADWRVRAARRGIWHAGTNIETPAEYKKRHREMTREDESESELVSEPEPERAGFFASIFRRGKRGGGSS